MIRAISRERGPALATGIDEPVRQGDWGDYLRAAIAALREEGVPLAGADVAIASELPLGSGLSSSAALCVGLVVAEIQGLEAGRAFESLRDLDVETLEEIAPQLSPLSRRRARHVVSENARVQAFVAALGTGDAVAAGARLREGMRSLQCDFEVSVPELDALCEIGDGAPGVYGSRLTGAGFGGCTLHSVDRAAAESVATTIAEGFEARFGRRPPVEIMRPADGATVLRL